MKRATERFRGALYVIIHEMSWTEQFFDFQHKTYPIGINVEYFWPIVYSRSIL